MYINFYWFVYIFSYIVCYMVVKQKNQKTMKAISICYAIMLMTCVIVGTIAALIFCKSWLWVFLSLLPIVLTRILVPELRERVPEFPDFSSVLFVLSFAVLVVVATAAILLMKFESFLSITCMVAAPLASFMTVCFTYFIPRGTNYSTEGRQGNECREQN